MFTEKFSKRLIWSGIIFIFLGLLFFLWDDFIFFNTQKIDSNKFGQFGDFVGGLIGSMWALAGVILFYIALVEQREDIRINRETLQTQVKALEQQIKEFELQRKELSLTREVFSEQTSTLKLQQFESTFFNSMNLFTNLVENITYYHYIDFVRQLENNNLQPEIYKGSDCFKSFYSELENIYFDKVRSYILSKDNIIVVNYDKYDFPEKIIQELTNDAYKVFFEEYQSSLGHYFRTMYNIIRFVDNQKVKNPKYYTNLIRAKLSTYEHLILFYNAHSIYGREKFKPLIEKYSLLNNMHENLLFDKRHLHLLDTNAYK